MTIRENNPKEQIREAGTNINQNAPRISGENKSRITKTADSIPVAIHGILVAGRALIHIIYISFAQMRLSVLRKVIRKTFAAEILMGLVLLIVAFSFVFQTVEPGIRTYFDAVWYCFAVVTTIGFGDIAVTSVLSRTLSIILGVYGIVVVAVITSVVVSFYNEVRDDRKDENTDTKPLP